MNGNLSIKHAPSYTKSHNLQNLLLHNWLLNKTASHEWAVLNSYHDSYEIRDIYYLIPSALGINQVDNHYILEGLKEMKNM